MRAAALRVSVRFERRSTSVDSAGDVPREWAHLGDAWASIVPISTREYFAAQQVKSDISHRVTTRARRTFALTPRDRMTMTRNGVTRYFDIRGVRDIDERGRIWEITVSETQRPQP